MTQDRIQREVLAHLQARGVGRSAGIRGRELAAACGCHLRQVGIAVRDLRLAGHAIGSDSDAGYYLAGADDLARTRADLKARIRALAEVLRALEPQVGGQLLLTLDGEAAP